MRGFKEIQRGAAVTLCATAMSIGLATAAHASTTGPPTTGRPASLAPLGGLRAVQAPRVHKAINAPSLPSGWQFVNSIYFLNVTYDYAISVQPTTSDGRTKNDLYMWAFGRDNTQTWDVYQYLSSNAYLFVSAYNGLCINVPGVTTTSGTQLIVYSCAAQAGGPGGEPKNEVFQEVVGNVHGDVLLPSYDFNLAVGIGSGFPSNGPWVIIYSRNYSNYEENWVPCQVGESC
jgi:hypothetical protein